MNKAVIIVLCYCFFSGIFGYNSVLKHFKQIESYIFAYILLKIDNDIYNYNYFFVSILCTYH